MDQLIVNQLPEKLRGKRVFVRLDVDQQYSSIPSQVDDFKLGASLPTLEYLISVGARIIIGTHLGDPGGRIVESLRLDSVSDRLAQVLGKPVRKIHYSRGRDALLYAAQLRDGDVLVLENLRFNPGEDVNDAELARELGQLCDVYCNDAFTLAHRALASTVGITRYVTLSVAGLSLAQELTMIESVTTEPKQPVVAIIAGTQLEEKLPIIQNLLPKIDRLFIGGTLAFKFLKAKGRSIGAAAVNEAFTPLVQDFLREVRNFDLVLPQDFIVVKDDEFRAYEEGGRKGPVPAFRQVLDTEILPTDLPVDIGPWTINRIKGLLAGGSTILWNGPLGIWEIEPFAAGTREVARHFSERVSPRHQLSILCGDSLSRAIHSFNFPVEHVPHLIPGGEPALQLLAGNPLPAIAALDTEISRAKSADTSPSQILLPVDGSEHSLEAARHLAKLVNAQDAKITLLHVAAPESELEHKFFANRLFSATNAALARQGLTSHHRIIVEGNPAEQILEFADHIKADLIAMGSHGMTGILRLIMGSVSKRVLEQAKCPVLIVRLPDKEMVKSGLLPR